MRRLAAIAIAAAMLTAAGCGEPPPDPVESSAPSGPPITCVGVPATTCSETREGVWTNGSPVPPVAIRVVTKGRGTTVVTYNDGSTDNGDWTHEDAGAPPG